MLYSRLPRTWWSMGDGGWRVVGVRKRARKCFWSIRCGYERGAIIGHLPRKVSRLCLLFLQRGDSCYRMYSHRRRKYSPDLPQGGLEVPCMLSTFQGNAYATRRFRKPVAWPEVVSDRHYWTSYKDTSTWNGAHYNSHRNVFIIRCRKNSL